ncbi:nitrous oxide reductase family maturation protein NosD [Streptomyces sp. NPDC051684]|uniref:nitrous oxide reductase family maturation protein NosD n=1 Tax=Streptomyces sp. NPDC051684 TaxID=3365670 RepID=UPI0037ABC54D
MRLPLRRRVRLLPLRAVLAAVVALAGLAAVTGCAADTPDSRPGPPGKAAVIRVPADSATIQGAVDAALPGDVVLVSPGVYKEAVSMRTKRVALRGTDRNKVVIDGEFKRGNGVTVTGPGSTVENLTVRNHLANGVLFTGVTDETLQGEGGGGAIYDPLDTVKFPPLKGFRGAYITAYNNALYGIYAFDARDGVIEHSYASGQADSGIYVGQCRPCATTVRHNTVTHNAVGIELTNSSEKLTVEDNQVRRNRVGITVNSNDLEALGPQRHAVIRRNTVADNNEPASPAQADGGFGIGIGIGGGVGNTVERNTITGNRAGGLLLRDEQGYPARGNTVRDNRVRGNGTDLVLAANAARGNCFTGNGERTTAPKSLPRACGAGGGAPLKPGEPSRVTAPPGMSFRVVPAPPAQPQRP